MLAVLLLAGRADAGGLTAIVDFDDQPAGTIVSSVTASSSQGPVGPILVSGLLPRRPGVNSALLFDSSQPTGNDFDLGSPNETFGGPGVGIGGEAGTPFENAAPLGNVLVIAEDLVDADGDGRIDDPDDAADPGMLITFEFSEILEPFPTDTVAIRALIALDNESSEPEGVIRLFDSSGQLVLTTSIPITGDNGVGIVTLGDPGEGIAGIARVEVELNGSGAVAALEIALPVAMDPSFVRGDVNADGGFDISDPIVLLHSVFGSATVPCQAALDVNDDNATIGLADAIFALSSLVGLGPPPPPPFSDCGTDPTSADFGCSSFPPCP